MSDKNFNDDWRESGEASDSFDAFLGRFAEANLSKNIKNGIAEYGEGGTFFVEPTPANLSSILADYTDFASISPEEFIQGVRDEVIIIDNIPVLYNLVIYSDSWHNFIWGEEPNDSLDISTSEDTEEN